jgi:hypothetical protein
MLAVLSAHRIGLLHRTEPRCATSGSGQSASSRYGRMTATVRKPTVGRRGFELHARWRVRRRRAAAGSYSLSVQNGNLSL